ncbi:MAG: hypothetical protein ACI90V_009826 [Bacillariaceae sp.]|jgi:hypothetical protein
MDSDLEEKERKKVNVNVNDIDKKMNTYRMSILIQKSIDFRLLRFQIIRNILSQVGDKIRQKKE